MKKLFLPVLLIFLTLPAFSQEDEYAKFQGVWFIADDDVEYFVFIDDVIFTNVDGGFTFRYTVENMWSNTPP